MQIAGNKRYAAAAGKGFTVSETAKNVEDAVGKIDVLVHSLANGPEVSKPLLETSRKVDYHMRQAVKHAYWPHVKAVVSTPLEQIALAQHSSDKIFRIGGEQCICQIYASLSYGYRFSTFARRATL